jgi:hypothetical protein
MEPTQRTLDGSWSTGVQRELLDAPAGFRLALPIPNNARS